MTDEIKPGYDVDGNSLFRVDDPYSDWRVDSLKDPLHQNPILQRVEVRRDMDEDPILTIPILEPTEGEKKAKETIENLLTSMEEQNRVSALAFQTMIENHEKILRGELPPIELPPSPQRPSLSEITFEVAKSWAKRSTCPRKQVGCVILSSEGFTLATGYNGAPRGAEHCLDIGCVEDNYGHCSRSIHAEINAIAQAALRGTSLRDSRVYVTLMPCLTCVKAMIQAGIREIHWEEDYLENQKDKEILKKLLEECKILWGIHTGYGVFTSEG